ncbi:unnamed protein product, partial [marine sediment metagenome]
WLTRDGGKANWRLTSMGLGFANEESFSTPDGVVGVNTVISSASPGCLLATDAETLHLWGWSMKGYAPPTEAVFAGADGVKSVALDASKPIASGADMKANWLLLHAPGGKGGKGNPVLVVFHRRPKEVRWSAEALREGVEADFDGPVGTVALVHPGRTGEAKDVLVKRSRMWSRAMLAYPEHASELWTVDTSKKNLPFEVMGTFNLGYNYHVIEDDWGTKPLEIAALPALASHALDSKYPGFAEGDWEKLGTEIKYQAYASC